MSICGNLQTLKENGRKYYLCKCLKCGKEMKVRSDYYCKHGGVCVSCKKKGNKQALKHGDYKTRLYKIWVGMFHRRYKAIKPEVCDEWKNYKAFKEWSLRNGYTDNLTIDRIDNGKGYCPSNCQWIPLKINAAKDKIIFSDEQCLEIYKTRKLLKITQIKMAKMLSVSRNTIQRAEKKARSKFYEYT